MTNSKKTISFTLLAMIATASLAGCNQAAESNIDEEESSRTGTEENSGQVTIANYEFDAKRGRALFISRGCVLCHSVNGVGGRAAYALDKETFLTEIDTVHFAARMWRGAPEMLKLQQMELGYQIAISAQDLADLAAFAENPEQQGLLTLDQVPVEMQESFLNEFLWIDEEYDAAMDQD